VSLTTTGHFSNTDILPGGQLGGGKGKGTGGSCPPLPPLWRRPWYTVGTVLVDMWRLVHQWSFFAVLTVSWLFLTIGVPIVTCLPRLYKQCTNRQKQSIQQKWPLVYQSSHVYWDCTNSVPMLKTVKNSQKTVKTAKMTIGVPIVTCLPRLYQQCTNRQKQRKTVKRQSKQQKWGV